MWQNLSADIAEEFGELAGGGRYEAALEQWSAYRSEKRRESRLAEKEAAKFYRKVGRTRRAPPEPEADRLLRRARQAAAHERRLIADRAAVAAAGAARMAARVERMVGRLLEIPISMNKYERNKAIIAEIRANRPRTELPHIGRSPELEARAQRISAALAAKRAAGWVNPGRGGIGRRRKDEPRADP